MKSILDTYVKYRNRIPIKGIDEPEASFFINYLGKMMSANAVYLHFRRILEKCNITYRGKGQGPRVHDVRHTLEIYPDLIKETGKNLGDIFPDITNQTNPL